MSFPFAVQAASPQDIEAIRAFLTKHRPPEPDNTYDRYNAAKDAAFDIVSFQADAQPAGLFHITRPYLSLLVLGCGAAAFVENGEIFAQWGDCPDPSIFIHIAHSDPIGQIRQASQEGRAGLARMAGLPAGMHSQSMQARVCKPNADTIGAPLLLSMGARALPFTPCTENADTCAQALGAALTAWSDAQDRPFALDLTDHQEWDDAQAAALTDILSDTYLALGFHAAYPQIEIRATGAGEAFSIWDTQYIEPLDGEDVDKLMWLVDKLVKTDVFVGHTWEYNDGAVARMDGYYTDQAVVASCDFSATSQHAALAARKRTQDRLASIIPQDTHDQQMLATFFAPA